MGSAFQCRAVEQALKKYLSNVPVVMVNGYLELNNVYGVIADEYEGTAQCVELLCCKGHRNTAFIISEHTVSNENKLGGFFEGGRRTGCNDRQLVYECEGSPEAAYEITKKVMQEHPETNGLIYAVDLMAAGGVRALLDLGYKVPEQAAVIGIDNSIYTRICNPKLTSLDNKLPELSTAAFKILSDTLQGKITDRKRMILSAITERETT